MLSQLLAFSRGLCTRRAFRVQTLPPHTPKRSRTMPPRGRPSAVSPSPRGRAGASPSPAPAKAVAKTAKKGSSGGFFTRHGNVYLYVPNLIGARARDPGARAGSWAQHGGAIAVAARPRAARWRGQTTLMHAESRSRARAGRQPRAPLPQPLPPLHACGAWPRAGWFAAQCAALTRHEQATHASRLLWAHSLTPSRTLRWRWACTSPPSCAMSWCVRRVRPAAAARVCVKGAAR